MSEPFPPVPENGALIPYEWSGTYSYGTEELEAVAGVIRARSPYRYYGHALGRHADTLEAAYALRLGRKYTVAVNSGSAAIAAALGAFNIGPGDEVLVPGYLWCSCLSAVVRAGAIPRLVEIDESFCMDPSDLERKIGPHSRAIMLVHMSGAPGAIDQICEIARRRKLFLLEDCAQANGATYHGRQVGSFGDAGIFSFQINKNITAGEGGLFVCDDQTLYRRAWSCHDQGYPRNEGGRIDPSDPQCQLWGQGSRCPELIAAVINAQLPKLDRITSQMRDRKYRLKAKLSDIPGLKFRRIDDPAGDCGSFLLLIWPNAEICTRMVGKTRASGVQTGKFGQNNICMTDWHLHIYYKNVSLVHKRPSSSSGRPWNDPLNAFAVNYQYGEGALPATDNLIARSSLLAIPPVLSYEAIDKISAEFHKAASSG
jgi:8-amino-3,8-dideoxy-alpha-D-manno-octulosonate transaminase